MSRHAALAVVALLLTAGFAPVVAAGPTTPQPLSTTDATPTLVDGSPEDDGQTPANNTTRRLPLTGAVTGNYSTVDMDFGGAMALSSERVQSQYQVSLVSVQLESVQSQEARTAIVNAYLDAVVEELDALYAAETTAVTRYRAGEISAETLLVRLAVIDMRARAIEDAITRIQTDTGSIPRSAQFRIESIRLELEGFETDVRQHVATALSGTLNGAVNPLHVSVTETGLVVEMLDDDVYHRNAIRFDNRDTSAPDEFDGDVEEFRQRVQELYAWSYSEQRGPIEFATYLDRDLYSSNYRHSQGSLTVYMDGGTQDVFREHQSLVLNRLPRLDSREVTGDNVSVSVTPTPRGGPVLVNVSTPGFGNTSAVPLDAVVRVNGHTVGRTNSDGELWALSPVGDYEVSVVHDGTRVNVSGSTTTTASGSTTTTASGSTTTTASDSPEARRQSFAVARLPQLAENPILSRETNA